MAELLEEQRETWGTRTGFVLAAVGSAVGLGNLWKFPYMLYDNGGAAFLLPYIIAMFAVGIPMLILEFSIGHFTQRAAPDAFAHSHRKLEFVGWWGIILGFVIITFYPVILAYCFSFLVYSIEGIFNGGNLPWAGEGIEGVQKAKSFFYDEFLCFTEGNALGAIRPNIVIVLVLTWLVMYFCIFRGVKLVDKIVRFTVVLPWLMLLVLTVNGLLLPGSIKGLAYYLNPDWSQLAKPATWQYAFGQAFFSLSLAFGVMITYASFLHRKSDINNNAAIIGLADFATSFIAGLAIFATLGAMSFATAQAGNPVEVEKVVEGGPGLAFVAFPYALAQLPGSAWWSFIFFFTLITLGIDSAFSITESVLAGIVDKTGWRRSIVLPVMSLVGLGIGLVYATRGGLNWLGTISGFIDGTWGIAFVGLLECILLGWFWRLDWLRRHANARSEWKLGIWWDYLIRIFIPIVLGSLFFWSLVDDLTKEGGVLRSPSGGWILQNCVGMSVMVLAPVLAILFSIFQGYKKTTQPNHSLNRQMVKGKAGGAFALVLSVASSVLMVILLTMAILGRETKILLLMLPAPAVTSLIISNFLLKRCNTSTTRASWLARWAGMLATVDISGFLALCLIYFTDHRKLTKSVLPSTEQLNSVSYVILSIVILLIIGGFGWCFYRSVSADKAANNIQHADEE
ncbi:sodium-dependent transporter [Planctomycetota bacterium]